MANPRVQDLSDPAKPVLREIATDSITGNLTVTGSVGVGNDVSITDDLTVGNAATVTGTVTAGGFTTAGNATVNNLVANNTAVVHGATTLYGAVQVNSAITTTGNITTTGDLTCDEITCLDCDVTGSLTANDVNVTGFIIGPGIPSGTGAAIPDAAGGGTVDTEARAAINALLAQLRTKGFIAP